MRFKKFSWSRRKRTLRNWVLWLGTATLLSTVFSLADTHKDIHFNLPAGSTVYVINQNGNITVHSISGRRLQVTTVRKSDKVEIDASQTGNRVTLRTHMLQRVAGDEARVDYDISLPSDANVNIDSETGPIKIENLQGNIIVDSDAGDVSVANVTNGTVEVQTINSAITLTNIKNSRVSVTTTGGTVKLAGVTGPKVAVEATNGGISYDGDFAGGGSYSLTNHSGDIDVKVPANASVDLTARSVKGTVTNDFPFQKPQHPTFQMMQGKSFAGTSNAGQSSVELRSFSGKISVQKQ